jgi:glycosyltransferase involved in cell wall biosynthesis
MKISILIPTRNRPDLVSAAITSVLGQGVADLEVLVSDNSSPEASEKVRALCASIADPRLRYIRPPAQLAMGLHWSWALRQATGDYVGIVTDRSIMASGALPQVAALLEAHDIDVVSALFDWVAGYEPPYTLIQKRYSGALMTCDSRSVADLVRMMRLPWFVLPRGMNCFVRRTLMEEMVATYGHIVESISPDFYFGFLLLDHRPRFHYWDYPVYVHYGLNVSNGWGFERGDKNRTVADFLSLVGKDYDRTPPGEEPYSTLSFSTLPWIWTARGNIMIEWERIRTFQKSGRLGEVDLAAFHLAIADELAYQIPGEMRARNERLLEAFRVKHGLPPEPLARKARRLVDQLARSPVGLRLVLPALYRLADLGFDPLDVYRHSYVAGQFATHQAALVHHGAHPRKPSPTPAFDVTSVSGSHARA